MTNYTDEELQELHSTLYAFLSFMDDFVLEKMGKYDKIALGHVRAMKRRLDEILQEHGGRLYEPQVKGHTS